MTGNWWKNPVLGYDEQRRYDKIMAKAEAAEKNGCPGAVEYATQAASGWNLMRYPDSVEHDVDKYIAENTGRPAGVDDYRWIASQLRTEETQETINQRRFEALLLADQYEKHGCSGAVAFVLTLDFANKPTDWARWQLSDFANRR